MKEVIVITGVNKGLGLSLLNEAVSRGLEVEGVSKSPKSDLIPENVNFTQLDCTNIEQAAAFWQMLHEKYSSYDRVILINNAGTYLKKSFDQVGVELVMKIMSDGYFSAVNMAKGLLTHFSSSTIINIVSTNAIVAGPNKTAYGATKAATANFFSALRGELPKGQHRILNLYPGPINTWSPKPEPGCTDPDDLSKWIISSALLTGTFEIADCTVLPFGS